MSSASGDFAFRKTRSLEYIAVFPFDDIMHVYIMSPDDVGQSSSTNPDLRVPGARSRVD